MIYIVCFMLSTAFAWLASKAKDRTTAFVFSAVSVLVLCVLGGLRDISIGTDTKGYAMIGYNAAEKSQSFTELLDKNLHGETGFHFINYIVSKTLGHLNWTLFIYQLITMTCFYIAAWRHRMKFSLPLFWLVFLCLFYNTTYNAIRHLMAASVIFMGLHHLEARRYLKFSLYIAFACLFHDSAVINFPLLVGVHMLTTSETVRRDNRLKLFITAAMMVILVLAVPIMTVLIQYLPGASRFSFYLNQQANYTYSNRATYTLMMGAELIVLALYRKQADMVLVPAGGGDFYQFMLIFCILYQSLVRFYADRILTYFDCLNVFFMATMPRFIRNKYLRLILSASIISVSMFYWWHVFVRGNSSQTYPYKSIL